MEVSGPSSRRECICRLRLIPVVMVSQPSDAETDQHDETGSDEEADHLQRQFCPAVHFCYRQEVDRRFPIDDLE